MSLCNVLDKKGRTKLYLATKQGNLELARGLLIEGADPNIKCSIKEKERAPLHIAAYLGQLKFVKLLVENGAKVDIKDDAGITPLYYSASKKSRDRKVSYRRRSCES